MGGRTKFNGHFNANSLSLETTGVTSHPTTGSRAAVMQDFLKSIASNDRQITAISADPAKNIDISIGLSFNQSRNAAYNGF